MTNRLSNLHPPPNYCIVQFIAQFISKLDNLFFSFQTPRAWVDERRRGSHKRSASCGSTDQLKEVRHLQLL